MRPLLKWTWWKFDEFKFFEAFLPKFDRYFEPFFWGGWVFFQLQNKQLWKSYYINDRSVDLINFYTSVKDVKFINYLNIVNKEWDASNDFIISNKKELLDFFSYDNTSQNIELSNTSNVFTDELYKEIIKSVKSKKKRLLAIFVKEWKVFNNKELDDHIETAVKWGIYMYFRGIINKVYKKWISNIEYSAYWFFVREFCYASMFRYNSKGEFNIPYGWTSYNWKNILSKINEITKKDTIELFNNTNINNLDFYDFISKYDKSFTENDFIFLDPPYDTEFSKYDNNEFNKNDQVRLRDCLIKINCKWMVVIKNTDFIFELYNKEWINIKFFDKKYAYEVRRRNEKNKDVEHLVITNY